MACPTVPLLGTTCGLLLLLLLLIVASQLPLLVAPLALLPLLAAPLLPAAPLQPFSLLPAPLLSAASPLVPLALLSPPTASRSPLMQSLVLWLRMPPPQPVLPPAAPLLLAPSTIVTHFRGEALGAGVTLHRSWRQTGDARRFDGPPASGAASGAAIGWKQALLSADGSACGGINASVVESPRVCMCCSK